MALIAVAVTPIASAQTYEEDYDESIRRPIRRLHPEREREKAMKAYQQEQERLEREKQQGTARPATGKKGGKNSDDLDAHHAYLDSLLNQDYTIHEIVADPDELPPAAEPYRWVDERIDGNRSSLLRQVASDNPSTGVQRFLPSKVSMNHTENAIYFYYQESAGEPQSLHLRIQYYADDPLNYDKIVFYIDGFEYVFHPSNTRRGARGRMYWEVSDDALIAADRDLVYALTHCNWARMTMKGANGIDHVKMLSEDQLTDMRTMLNLYLLSGGRIN